ncbi:hypothetical protein GCM10025771_40030 [Niveibacterium umoris]|uniref:LPS-assembly protein LptD n=1 Tax=Niveibacterium umoris TaxID=1193620 RepID=A0A840BCJ5_9RHOO|nr:hypothetical protein [Niveibacterium umoris]MBB4010795.1 hypothetical protein [Niveibacterium umoris]
MHTDRVSPAMWPDVSRPSSISRIALAVALALPMLAQADEEPAPRLKMSTELGALPHFDSRPAPGDSVPPVDGRLALRPAVFSGRTGGVDYAPNAVVGRIEVDVDRNNIPADGQSSAEVEIRVFGRDGKPLNELVVATVEVRGRARLLLPDASTDELGAAGRDLDRVTPGVQVRVKDGLARLKLVAPAEPQDVLLRVTVGAERAGGVVTYVPELREFVAVGIVEGVISLSSVPSGSVTESGLNDGFEYELRRWSRDFDNGKGRIESRAAMYLKGKISGDALLTAAYDSDKATYSRLMRDVNPDAWYPVYGDASTTGFDARSSSPFYVRIDKDRNYILWGDYVTGDGFSQLTGGGNVAPLQTRMLGAYNRIATGLRGHVDEGALYGNAFASFDTLSHVVEQYPLNGTSILPGVSRGEAVVNSERVSIVTYDKDMLTRVVSTVPLERYKDYIFEPFNGRIQLLGGDLNYLDPNGNPRYVRIEYEVRKESGDKFWIFGGDAQYRLGPSLEVGGNVVDDQNPDARFRLYSGNARIKLGDNTAVVLEMARSEADLYLQADGHLSTTPGAAGVMPEMAGGNAVRVEARHDSDYASASLRYQKTDAAFVNPTAAILSGKTDIKARVAAKTELGLVPFVEATRLQDDVLPNSPKREVGEVGVTWLANKDLSVTVGVRRIEEDAGLTSTSTLPPNYGTEYGATPGFGSSSPGALAPISSTPVANSHDIKATTARVTALYKLTDRASLIGEAETAIASEGSDVRQSRWLAGASYQLAERTRLYGRYENQTGLGSALSLNQGDRSNVFSMGVESSYFAGSQLYSEYRLRDAISGESLAVHDMQFANGVRSLWEVAPGVAFTTSAEYLKVMEGGARDALALGAGIDYTAHPLWKGATRVDWRRLADDPSAPGNQGEEQYMWTIAGARKIDRDWTALVRNYLLYNRYHDNAQGQARGDTVQDRFQLGAAWRPVDHNRWNALGRYEYKVSHDQSGLAQEDYRVHLVSALADYHPSRPWWLTGRVAAMDRVDVIPETGARDRYQSGLLSGRVVYDVTERWDLGFLTSVMYSPQGSTTQWAQGLEAGYLIQTNLWASAGYNWSGFNAGDLAGGDYLKRGFFLRLRLKFDEKLMLGADREVNRTLDRDGTQPARQEGQK